MKNATEEKAKANNNFIAYMAKDKPVAKKNFNWNNEYE